ncbi:hypothetical protein VST63_21935 [Mycolicibacterium sp. 050232]|uniref:hypothetical protein n=1 Tax=Mycolicibacterium sp. 050232 TaxID=3113982 RepID=UPI002E2C1409|nr:hypothetical protein [Mycolicibacterium sp. 050232]MED5815029.1 hypothetical protein [Mycolicibacterium sp. 050232]
MFNWFVASASKFAAAAVNAFTHVSIGLTAAANSTETDEVVAAGIATVGPSGHTGLIGASAIAHAPVIAVPAARYGRTDTSIAGFPFGKCLRVILDTAERT